METKFETLHFDRAACRPQAGAQVEVYGCDVMLQLQQPCLAIRPVEIFERAPGGSAVRLRVKRQDRTWHSETPLGDKEGNCKSGTHLGYLRSRYTCCYVDLG